MIRNMILIFAVDCNWNIGYDGDMLFKIHEDLKRFRRLTEHNIVVMGRKTFESLPEQKPLPNRTNIIITSDQDYKVEGAVVVHALEALFTLLKEINPHDEMKTFMIGGGNLTKQLLKHCDTAYITKITKSFDDTDTFIPNLDELPEWEVVKESGYHRQEDLVYKYVDYKRK